MGKYKDLLIGVGLIVFGTAILLSYAIKNNKMEERINDLVEENMIIINDHGEIVDDDSIEEEELTGIVADQEIKVVKSYVNVLEIPHLSIKAYINEGVDKEALSYGVGHHTNTAVVGDPGNCVIAGHCSTTYRCIFNNLDKIEILDTFYLYDSKGKRHEYYVTEKYICEPENTRILFNIGEGISTTTLYTCSNKGKQRLVVIGKEFDDEGLVAFKRALQEPYYISMREMNDSIRIERVSEALAMRKGYKDDVSKN